MNLLLGLLAHSLIMISVMVQDANSSTCNEVQLVGDGVCDDAINNANCNYDGGTIFKH